MAVLFRDVVVIGGGVTGALVAYELSRQGAGAVLLERGRLAGGATGAAPGVLSLASKSPGLPARLARASLPRFPALLEELGADAAYRKPGSLLVYETDEEEAAIARRIRELAAEGIDLRLIDSRAARELQPVLAGPFAGAAWSPEDALIDPVALTAAAARAAAAHGVELALGERAVEIRCQGGRIASVVTDRRRIGCRWVVNAGGAWAASLAASLDLTHPVEPRRGQLIAVAPIPGATQVRVATAAGIFAKRDGTEPGGFTGTALTPAADGTLVLGGSNEDVGFAEGTTATMVATIALRAGRLFPGLADARVVRAWSGLRPHSRTGAPIVGAAPERPGYVVATGQGGDGIALAPFISRYVAAVIVRDAPGLDLEEFLAHPER